MEKMSNKQLKAITSAVLKAQSKTYNDWLQEQHMRFLKENSEIIVTTIEEKSR